MVVGGSQFGLAVKGEGCDCAPQPMLVEQGNNLIQDDSFFAAQPLVLVQGIIQSPDDEGQIGHRSQRFALGEGAHQSCVVLLAVQAAGTDDEGQAPPACGNVASDGRFDALPDHLVG